MKCSYCNKEVDKPVMSKLIYQSSRQVFDSRKKRMVWKKYVAQEMKPYCSDQCATHDQMAHEG